MSSEMGRQVGALEQLRQLNAEILELQAKMAKPVWLISGFRAGKCEFSRRIVELAKLRTSRPDGGGL